jgi:hypothetical protein
MPLLHFLTGYTDTIAFIVPCTLDIYIYTELQRGPQAGARFEIHLSLIPRIDPALDSQYGR